MSAEKAWEWAQANPDIVYDQNSMNKDYEPAISTGGYGDYDFRDEFIWAAAELYITTKKTDYYDSVNMLPDSKMPLPSWNNVRLFGYYSLARFKKVLNGNAKKDFPGLKSGLLREADRMINGVLSTAYQSVMGESARDFVWGSNSVAANEGILLINAYKLTGEDKYLDQALGNLDYITGSECHGLFLCHGFWC